MQYKKNLRWPTVVVVAVSFACLFLRTLDAETVSAQDVPWSAAEKSLSDAADKLRSMSEAARAAATQNLAAQVRHLPASSNKLRLAINVASLSTEGDLGHATVQEAAWTLAQALREMPLPWVAANRSDGGKFVPALLPAYGYSELATLVRYEHVDAALASDEHYRSEVKKLELQDRKRSLADFSLSDLSGRTWQLSRLRGKVVLVNFWATWCPPCRQEIPALDGMYARFKSRGFVVLGISEEEAAKVRPFVRRQGISYPVLLDPKEMAQRAFDVEGIPKSFVYDRAGRLVAQAMDARSPRQFQEMLQMAGIKD